MNCALLLIYKFSPKEKIIAEQTEGAHEYFLK